MSRLLVGLVLWFACVGGGAASVAGDADPSIKILEVRWGLQGRFKLGAWTPVSIELKGGPHVTQGVLQVSAIDPDERLVDYVADPQTIEVPANQTTTVVRFVRFGKQQARLQVEFAAQDGTRVTWQDTNARPPRGARTSQPTIGLIGNDPGFRQQIRRSDRVTTEAIELFVLDPNVHPLPEHALGFDALDLLVISTSSLQVDTLSPRVVAAIDAWVQQGGRLVWYGTTGVTTLVEANPDWRRLIPGVWNGVNTLPRLSSLEGRFGGKGAITPPAAGIPVGVLVEPRGLVMLTEGEGRRQSPLWVRAPHGLGQITFLAVDVDQPPLLAWPGLPDLIRACMDDNLGADPVGNSRVRHGQASHWGFRDLTGQLRSALDQFSGVTIFPVVLIGVLALAYIGLVGPIDHLLVTRWLRQPTWTWFTFPAVIATFCGFTVWINQRWKGTDWVAREAHVVDLDAVSGFTRGYSHLSLFGPKSGLVHVKLETPHGVPGWELWDRTVSWFGLPGDGFGGMDQAARGWSAGDRYRSREEPTSIAGRSAMRSHLTDFPFQAHSSHSFVGQWTARNPVEAPGALSADFDHLLSGSLVNTWGVPLEGAWICHGRWAYSVPGTWMPEQRVELQALSSPRDVRALLTQRRFITRTGKEARDETTPWDRASTNVQDIVRMMLLHEAAGGRSYTGLMHRHNSRWDLSGHLGIGRAVVLGWTPQALGHWNITGAALDTKFAPPTNCYRIVLPVQLAAGGEVRPVRSD